ncbi:hypothetical protein EZS27_019505 [termite gut metagenome]|uniref:Uncharacterized protein n=1 Tax=termite gut metagenome TaxID=433724 RepID=A0A5J4RFF7_9ZZZZ
MSANGTGKSLLAEQLTNRFNNNGLTSRYLIAERLIGLEKSDVSYYGGGRLMQGFNISDFQNYKTYAERGGLSSSAIITLMVEVDEMHSCIGSKKTTVGSGLL